MAPNPTQQVQPSQPHTSKSAKRKKLARLPANARVDKRPLLRPAIPSAYSGAQEQKVVYISTKTPFLSAIKRVEKLLHLVDKRAVQSATTLSKQNRRRLARQEKLKRGGDGDEILEIAEEAERVKRRRRVGEGGDDGEEVVLKGTGKAISKVLELGLWFQQREEYVVRLRTGSVGAIDDVTTEVHSVQDVDPEQQEQTVEHKAKEEDALDAGIGGENDARQSDSMELDNTMASTDEGNDQATTGKQEVGSKAVGDEKMKREVTETRIRYTNVLEVGVTLR